MNEIVTIRCENDEVIMSLNEEVEFQVLIDTIQERLRVFKKNKAEAPKKIKLDLGHRKTKPSELLEIFDVIMKEEIVLIDGIDFKNNDLNDTEIYEGIIRGGQIKYFDNSIMIMGDINPGATIYCAENLYVVGKIKGKVIAKNKKSMIVASEYNKCLIQIYDSEPLFIDKLYGNTLTYENGLIKVHDTNMKERLK
ncbi:MAG: hypothetical protein IJV94_02265 [Bacilli bacterium]|nr:hypothetical protein [Bacilli bacterium]